jgi:hypothetical protein|tara:strand:- start:380 stop:511 length:132 start_codon:yes stop_codon:yes gene_type:complete
MDFLHIVVHTAYGVYEKFIRGVVEEGWSKIAVGEARLRRTSRS